MAMEVRVLPGVYTQVSGQGQGRVYETERGIVAMGIDCPMLDPHTMIRLGADNYLAFCAKVGGINAVLVSEIFKNANKALIYVLNSATDVEVGLSDYAAFFAALETEDFNTIALNTEQPAIKTALVSFVRDLREKRGRYVTGVVSDLAADYVGILSLKNGVVLSDNVSLSAAQATAYIAGATASVPLNESLTNRAYIGGAEPLERYDYEALEQLVLSGHMVLVPSQAGGVSILKDINTLTTFTSERPAFFSKNKIVRIVDKLANDICIKGVNSYIGKVQNNENGRALFKAEILSSFAVLERSGILQEVSPEDIVVSKGDEIDSIVVEYAIRPADVIEQIHNTILVS